MKNTFLLLILNLIVTTALANTFEVGPTKSYKTPNELYLANVIQPGDTITIDVALY